MQFSFAASFAAPWCINNERVLWAILNSDFTVLLDGGLVKRDTPVVVSLEGKGRVQMSGNRVWVGNGG